MMLKALLRSFRCAFAGIGWALRTQRNLRIHAAATVVAIALGFVQNISAWKWCAVLLCVALVWAAELLNSALEILCDRITREQDEHIRLAKDAAAGAVLVCAIIRVVAALVFL
jgi:diacylglycerol kinase (ATP)